MLVVGLNPTFSIEPNVFWDNAGFVWGNTLENDISRLSLSAHVRRGKRLDAAKTAKVSQHSAAFHEAHPSSSQTSS